MDLPNLRISVALVIILSFSISPDVKGQKKCIIVRINDKSMKIGIQDNFGTLISNRSVPTLDFAHECSNLQSKMADIENVSFYTPVI